jgi:hypothetical protein
VRVSIVAKSHCQRRSRIISLSKCHHHCGREHGCGKAESQQGRSGGPTLCLNGLQDDPCPTAQNRKQGNAHGPRRGFGKPADNAARHREHGCRQRKRQHAADAAGKRTCRRQGCGRADDPISGSAHDIATTNFLARSCGRESLKKRIGRLTSLLRRFHDDPQGAMFFADLECQEGAAGLLRPHRLQNLRTGFGCVKQFEPKVIPAIACKRGPVQLRDPGSTGPEFGGIQGAGDGCRFCRCHLVSSWFDIALEHFGAGEVVILQVA